MQILIEKDAATKVPKEVADADEARGYVAQGFVVHVVNEDGSTSLLTEPAAPAQDEGASDAQEGQGQEGLLKPKRRAKQAD